MNQDDMRQRLIETARSLGISPVDLATAVSYESGFNPNVWGGSGGNYYGLIQFGPEERKQYGVDTNNVDSQLGPNGAIANYMRDRGLKPGMGLMDIYSTINAGAPGLYGRSDAGNGGAPGTVADKVNNQMADHRKAAYSFLGMPDGPKGQESYAPPVFGSMSPGAPQDNSIPMFVADRLGTLGGGGQQKQNPMQAAGEALTAATKEYAPARINGAFSGDARQGADGLMKLLQNPQALAQMMLQKRLA